jgi:hypothetical protein
MVISKRLPEATCADARRGSRRAAVNRTDRKERIGLGGEGGGREGPRYRALLNVGDSNAGKRPVCRNTDCRNTDYRKDDWRKGDCG